mmetsp:Transcript_24688/g.21920  ORF Transcript_24688/g.21920 Transcript_24688/m.21920 type:complete len:231 (+) Transcript_24688:17-709(+)
MDQSEEVKRTELNELDDLTIYDVCNPEEGKLKFRVLRVAYYIFSVLNLSGIIVALVLMFKNNNHYWAFSLITYDLFLISYGYFYIFYPKKSCTRFILFRFILLIFSILNSIANVGVLIWVIIITSKDTRNSNYSEKKLYTFIILCFMMILSFLDSSIIFVLYFRLKIALKMNKEIKDQQNRLDDLEAENSLPQNAQVEPLNPTPIIHFDIPISTADPVSTQLLLGRNSES